MPPSSDSLARTAQNPTLEATPRGNMLESNRQAGYLQPNQRGLKLTQLTNTLADLLGGERADHRRGQSLAEASMAAAALVATADGDVSFAERALIDQAIDALAERGAVSTQEAAALFNEFVDGIRANSSQGRRPALNALAEIEGVADAATIVLRIADAVASADGTASTAEINAVQDIAAALNAAAK